jgi:putative hydrolase of HD superfamily
MSIKRDLEFLYEIGTLRNIQRAWVQMLGSNVANLAEHHFRVVWLALILAKGEKVSNTEKIMKMALVHDIVESRTGDVHYISRQYTIRDEKLAISDMVKDTSMVEFEKLWEEYESKKSIEAKIVKDADNLDVDLELMEQEWQGNKIRKEFRDHRSLAVYKAFFTETARKLWQEIQKSNPHDWHLKGRNRFNAGDWKKYKK